MPLVLAAQDVSQLFRDLETVDKIDRQSKERLPLVVNYQLQGGYFTLPSARTFDAGVLGFEFAYVPPDHIWSLGFQFFDRLETTGNYGLGGSANRAVNLKWILLRQKAPFLPHIALGCNDFMGSHHFRSLFAAATAEFLPYNFEATLGWGNGLLRGLYGGLAWTPFRKFDLFLNNFTLAAECNAKACNAGLQLMLWDCLRLSASSLGSSNVAASAALTYNLGNSKGFLPKTRDPAPYSAPIDTEPLGEIRSRQELAQELAYAFQEQGFDLYTLYFIPGPSGKDTLWMKIVNVRYREETEVRSRIEYVLASLTPSNITAVTAVTEADGVPIHEYRFRVQDLRRYREGELGAEEFQIIAPTSEVSATPKKYDSALLYQRRKPIWLLTVRPWFRSFLASTNGKFEYEVGLVLNPEGYLFDQIYYNLAGTYTVKSTNFNINNTDSDNPSYLLNVRTDSILYNQSNSLHLDQAYLQKSWNMGRGWFSRFALGYFETAYAGAALEALYYPVHTNWAIGFEAATFLKRGYYGIGFQSKIRKFTSEGVRYFPYTGFQYFVDLYYQYKPLHLDFKLSGGQFLARDYGARLEAGRTFRSGLRVGVWYTLTNANDQISGHRYYDKGFSITMPLDLFLPKSSRTRIGYSMAARLRDCGATSATGQQLYPTLYWERYSY